MNSGKIGAGGRTDGRVEIEGSKRGPRGPKKTVYCLATSTMDLVIFGCTYGEKAQCTSKYVDMGKKCLRFVDIADSVLNVWNPGNKRSFFSKALSTIS